MKGGTAAAYLENERGLSPETIRKFRLGNVAGPLPGHEHLTGRISIPYLTPDDSVVAMKFRAMPGMEGPKYLSGAGAVSRLFNTPALEVFSSGIVVCEGEFDAMTVEQCGFPAVGIPGASSWTPVWERLFWQYDVIYFLADDDEAGKKAGKELAARLEAVRVIVMPGDVNSFVRQQGEQALRELLKAG